LPLASEAADDPPVVSRLYENRFQSKSHDHAYVRSTIETIATRTEWKRTSGVSDDDICAPRIVPFQCFALAAAAADTCIVLEARMGAS
jgi:hypothetical protein